MTTPKRCADRPLERGREGSATAAVVGAEDADRHQLCGRGDRVDDPRTRGSVADQVDRLGIVDDPEAVADLDPQAAAQPAADGRVIAFDARVDDRDGDAGAVGRPEDGSAIHDPERSVALEACACVGQERVAPGGESRIGHRAIGPDDVSGRLFRGDAGGR